MKNDEDFKIPDLKVEIPDYPNWRRGALAGLAAGLPVFAAVYFLVPRADFEMAGICALMACLAAGAAAAFRPPR